MNPNPNRKVVSIGLIDNYYHTSTYLFNVSPDLTSQMDFLNTQADLDKSKTPGVIFLTHAHIVYYPGLMFFGKEALNATKISTNCIPRMRAFLSGNFLIWTNGGVGKNPLSS